MNDVKQFLPLLFKSDRRCGRNGAFRKDNKRQTRKNKCHSKKVEPHDAHVIFFKSVYNLTKENEKFRILVNPKAKPFETK